MCVKVAYVNFNNKRRYYDDDDDFLIKFAPTLVIIMT